MSDIGLILGGKAIPATETESGDLVLEGLAVVFDSIDSEGEGFLRGAFDKSAKAFLAGSAPLCFNHAPSKILGKVLDLTITPAGLWMRARVDGAIRKHPELATIYEQIRRGSIKNLSVGGWFERVDTPGGPMIRAARLSEISATACGIDEKPSFAVIEGKALVEYDAITAEIEQLEALKAVHGRLALVDCQLAYCAMLQR